MAKATNTLTKEEKQELKRIETTKNDIEEAKALVETLLHKYLHSFIILRTEEDVEKYIDECIKNNVAAIDTETTGLNVYADTCVGICIHTPSMQEAYIPLNHVEYITRQKVENQVSEEFIAEQLQRLDETNTKVIMHNANFDIRVLRKLGIYLTCYWDTVIAAQILNENEKHGLKELYNKYILKDEADSKFSFGKLFSFKGTTFADIPIEIGAVYAAHDAKMTYELYQFQSKFLHANGKNGLDDAYNLFMNIEMPCVDAICNMEDTGFTFDFEYNKQLQDKYHTLLQEEKDILMQELLSHEDEINEWRTTEDAIYKEPKLEKDGTVKVNAKGEMQYKKSKSEQLPENIYEINLGSPTQLAILMYDVFKWPVVDKTTPRGTGEEILTIFEQQHGFEFARKILYFRHYQKMITAFIDTLPVQAEFDGKIHFSLNQYGAKTGRMSSSNPNIQQIPAANAEIRKMFVAPTYTRDVKDEQNTFIFKNTEEIDVTGNDDWVFVKELKVGDKIQDKIISNIQYIKNNISVQITQ